MSNPVVKSTDFSASDVSFSKIRKNRMGGKCVYLNNKDQKIYVQLPALKAPFGLSQYTDQGSGRTSYSIDLSLDGENEELLELLREIDELVLDTVHKNSKEWLNKAYKKDVMKDVMYKPLVREPSDPQYSPTLKLKVQQDRDGKFAAEAYNSDKQRMSITDIAKGTVMKTIVCINQIWFIDTKFGCSVQLQQCLCLPSQKLQSFAFVDEEEEEAPAPAPAPAAVSEEEEEEEEEFTEEEVTDDDM